MIIKGKETKAELFAYDGCHKIYLIESEHDRNHAEELKYDLYPINELLTVWNESCELRFIRNWQLDKVYISQFEEVTDDDFIFD